MNHISYEKAIHLTNEIGAILLDVQLPIDYEKKHIPGSYNIPLEQLRNTIRKIYPNPYTVFIVCCQQGIRSKVGASILENMGYQNVFNLNGGFENGG